MKHLRLVTFLFAAVILSGCSSLIGGESTPPAPLVDFAPSMAVRSLWATSVGGVHGRYLKLTPYVSDGIIYTANNSGDVTAVDAMTGRKLWRTHLRSRLISGVGGGPSRLYVGTDDGDVLALSRQNGAVLWYAGLSNEVLAPPVEAQGVVLAKAEDGNLVALSAANGKRLWGYSVQVPSLILRGSSQPQIVGSRAIVGFANGQVSAFSLRDGRLLWSQQIAIPHGDTVVERMVDIDADPHVADGKIYVATYQGRIAALTLSTGHLLWQRKLSSYSGLVVGPSKIYVSDSDGNVWALRRDNGSVSWRQGALQRRHLSGPALYRGAVVVGGVEGYLHWMSRSDGRFVARDRVDSSSIVVSPFVYRGRLYALSSGGTLEAIISQ